MTTVSRAPFSNISNEENEARAPTTVPMKKSCQPLAPLPVEEPILEEQVKQSFFLFTNQASVQTLITLTIKIDN